MKKLFLLLFALLAPGCASITASSTDSLRVHASPASAMVRVNGYNHGSAPASVEVSRRGRDVVEVTAPGYYSSSCNTNMSAGGGYIAADIALCVFLFPFGCISFIDAGGAWNQLENSQCYVTLVPEAPKENKL